MLTQAHRQPSIPSPIRVVLISQGIGQTKTLAMHEAEGRAHGFDYSYEIIDLDTQRRALIHRIESMRHRQKELQQSVRSAGDDERQPLQPNLELLLDANDCRSHG